MHRDGSNQPAAVPIGRGTASGVGPSESDRVNGTESEDPVVFASPVAPFMLLPTGSFRRGASCPWREPFESWVRGIWMIYRWRQLLMMAGSTARAP